MEQQSLYKKLAVYYDVIYSWKDYKKEVKQIKKLISKFKKSDGNELLEVGCGTGHHLKLFKQNFICMGVDINQGILDVAQKKVKGVKFMKADMVSFKINQDFDVITCLFSSIGYVKNYENLNRTIHNFANHLKIGGVVIIEPWFTKKSFKEGMPHMSVYEDNSLKIARLNVSKVVENNSILNMHYLIAKRNGKVEYFVDNHELGLFDTNRTLQYMKDAGLKCKYLKNGLMKDRGLFIGVKE